MSAQKNIKTATKSRCCETLIEKTTSAIMEEYPQEYQPQDTQPQADTRPLLPKAVTSMVLGICSIANGGTPLSGLVLAIIGLVKSRQALEIEEEYPGYYRGREMARAGKITSTIGLVIGIFYLLFFAFYFFIIFYSILEPGWDWFENLISDDDIIY